MTTPLADRFLESFDDYCERNGIVGDLVPFAEAMFLAGYKEGYDHACADRKRVEEVVFAKGSNDCRHNA